MSDDEKDEAIFRLDTVPPPAGEDDAYSAPTRVGPMAAAVVEEMMVASVRKAAELNAAATEKAAASEKKAAAEADAQRRTPVSGGVAPTSKSSPVAAGALSESDLVPDPAPSSRAPSSPRAPVASRPPPVPQRPASPAAAAATAAPPPRMYDEADDEENAATLLSRAAKAPVVQPTPAPQSAPAFPAASSAPVVSPFAPSQNAGPSPASNDAALAPTQRLSPSPPLQLPVFLPLAVGFTIFAIGLLLYFWAR